MVRAPYPSYVPMVEAATRGPTLGREGPGMDADAVGAPRYALCLDLHRALDARAFRDPDCRFGADGAAAMARLVVPEPGRALAGH